MAKAIEALIAYGHDEDVVWSCTPRQVHARLELATARRKGELRANFALWLLAARGEESNVKKAFKDLDK